MNSQIHFSHDIYKDYKKAIHQYIIKCSLGETKRPWPTELIDLDLCGLKEIREPEGV